MRGFSTCVVLAAVLFAAGCGGGGGGGGSSSAAQASGEAAKPANVVVRDASKAAREASSFHISGHVHSSGRLLGVDLSLVQGKGGTGTVTVGGTKVDLVLVGNSGYMRASSAFWKKYASQAGGFAQLFADKWIKFPAKGGQVGSLTGLTDTSALFKSLTTTHGKLENQGETTYNGQSVVAIHDVTKNSTLYVAATGTPYPVGLVKAAGRDAGTVAFDHWNEPVTLTAPKGALDFAHLGASG